MDAFVVLLFVVIGRETHDEGNALVEFFETAAPFFIGLAVGWGLVARRKVSPPVVGVVVWASTLIVGMFVRRLVFDDGTAFSFVLVATLFLGAGMLGRRLVWRRLLA